MRIIFFIFLFLPILTFSQKDFLRKKPTTIRINYYVERNKDSIIIEFENFFNIKINEVSIESDNIEDYTEVSDSGVLGRYFTGINLIIVTNQEKYIGYSLKETPKRKLIFSESNFFVKCVIIHELSHAYIDQVSKNKNYKRGSSTFNSAFIEEGISEYCTIKMNEMIVGNYYKPTTIEELYNPENKYKILYKYGAEFVKDFLDKYGFERGVYILLNNSPPTDEEILEPKKFWSRINFFI